MLKSVQLISDWLLTQKDRFCLKLDASSALLQVQWIYYIRSILSGVWNVCHSTDCINTHRAQQCLLTFLKHFHTSASWNKQNQYDKWNARQLLRKRFDLRNMDQATSTTTESVKNHKASSALSPPINRPGFRRDNTSLWTVGCRTKTDYGHHSYI